MNKVKRDIAGLVLWWAEGTKSRKDKRWKNAWTYNVEITNTDPKIISLFLDFIRSNFEIDPRKLKVQIQIHEGDSKSALEQFWSKVTNVPLQRFNKTIIRPAGNKAGKTNGTCKVRYCDKSLYTKLASLLERLLKDTGCSAVG